MKKIATILSLAALVAAAPASASVVLTKKQAQTVVRQSAEATLGSLVYRSVGSAPVRVANCRVNGKRGQCDVVVSGLQRCSYTGHVLRTADTYLVWGTNLRCSA